MSKVSSSPKLPSVFPYQSAFYFKQAGKRVYVCTMEVDQKDLFAKKIRPTLNQEQQQQFLKQLALQDAINPENQNQDQMRIDTLAQLYLSDRTGLIGEKRQSAYESTLKSFCEFAGALKICEATPSLVRRWKEAHGKTWKSSSYIRAKYKVILQMFNFAVVEKYISSSPLTTLGKALSTEAPDNKREYVIYDEEKNELLKACKPEFKNIVIALLETGRRPDEIANVKKSEVVKTTSGLMWRIKHHKNFKKTQKAESIYLTPEMEQLTQELLNDPKNKSQFLFVTKTGAAWTTNSIGKYWTRTYKAAKITSEAVPYSCRHSYITKALHNGVPLPVVAMMVGNSVEIIAKHYAHIEAQHVSVYFQFASQAVKQNNNYRSEEFAALKKVEAAI